MRCTTPNGRSCRSSHWTSIALGSLTFEAPDAGTFACLRLAREAGIAGGTAPCVLNAANEVAVHAFLAEQLGFMQIGEVIEETLGSIELGALHSFESLSEADRRAREVASAVVSERAAV